MTTRSLRTGGIFLFGALFLMQLVPYRVSNPPVHHEPAWQSPESRALVVRACFDCHSNETRRPWYAKVAPISWWTTNHVREGRSAVNFSEWDRARGEEDLANVVAEGSMPPGYFTWFGLNKDAVLSPSERQVLVAQLQALQEQVTPTGRD